MVQEIPPPVQLMQMLFGFAASRAIGVSAELGIADLLKDGPKTAEELAQQTSVHARSLTGYCGLVPVSACMLKIMKKDFPLHH